MHSNKPLLWIILTLTIFSSGCGSEPAEDYAGSLSDCLSKEEIALLNEAAAVFESQLKQRYDGMELNSAYRAYLGDFQTMDVPPDFLASEKSQAVLRKMKSSVTFERIFARQSTYTTHTEIPGLVSEEVISPGMEAEQNRFDPYGVDPSGAYMNCLHANSGSAAIQEYVATLAASPQISRGLLAAMLMGSLTDEDLNQGLTRLVIAMGFYYELGLMFAMG